MCLACEQDAIWIAYLESQGLLKPDDPAAVDALFGAFPVQPLPFREGEGNSQPSPSADVANENNENEDSKTARNAFSYKNPFSCDDPTA
jgi:hypothetical protein